MRGFLSLVLVLALLAPLFVVSALYISSDGKQESAKNTALSIEKEYYLRAEIREAMLLALKGAATEGRAEARLVRLEEFLKAEDAGDADITLWCGLATEEELNALVAEMQKEGKARQCPSCWPVGATVDGVCCNSEGCRPDSYGPCQLILFRDLRGDLSILGTLGTRFAEDGSACTYPTVVAAAGKHSLIGASIYKLGGNVSSLVILPEKLVVR